MGRLYAAWVVDTLGTREHTDPDPGSRSFYRALFDRRISVSRLRPSSTRPLLSFAMSVLVIALSAVPVLPQAVPPRAQIVPHRFEEHGRTRIDNYYWLRERDDPQVIEYLEAENRYMEAVMKPTEQLQEELYREIRGRIREDDSSAPYRHGAYWYYTRWRQGEEYPLHARKKAGLEAPEEILLDENQLAAGHAYFRMMSTEVSHDDNLLAYAADSRGRFVPEIRFKDLRTGKALPDVLSNGGWGSVAWSSDNATVLYVKKDLETLRAFQVWRHALGTDPIVDELVYEETDETFEIRLATSQSRRYLLIVSEHTLSSEVRYLPAGQPRAEPLVFQSRERDHLYSVDHLGDSFYIRTNRGAKNFRLMRTAVEKTGSENWEELIPHRTDVLLEDFTLFDEFLVLGERKNGITQLRVRPWSGEGEYSLDFDETAYMARAVQNLEPDSGVLRFVYTSLTTPESTYEHDMRTRKRTLLKREEVVGGYDPGQYATERLEATARDGIRVPVSLVYRRDRFQPGENPLLLYGYGSYGNSTEPVFRSEAVSLLDRGFVYAIAHIRGGQELGRQWYEDGKLLKKKNTFTDFIDSAEFLAKNGYANPERLYAMGGSAGGLLMGAVINMRPDLFHGVVAHVPFVDVVTTMLDESIPLTTFEWDEWGDPRTKESYDYMMSYSPYDNVRAVDYPHLLVTTGLQDSQVPYWEPAKWVAKLRALKTDQNRLLFKTTMAAGHGGPSGRFRRYRETALHYAFLVDLGRKVPGGTARERLGTADPRVRPLDLLCYM